MTNEQEEYRMLWRDIEEQKSYISYRLEQLDHGPVSDRTLAVLMLCARILDNHDMYEADIQEALRKPSLESKIPVQFQPNTIPIKS